MNCYGIGFWLRVVLRLVLPAFILLSRYWSLVTFFNAFSPLTSAVLLAPCSSHPRREITPDCSILPKKHLPSFCGNTQPRHGNGKPPPSIARGVY